MRILFFIDRLITGGKERRLTELMKELKTKPEIDFGLAVMDEDIQYKDIFDLDISIEYIIRKSKRDISVFYKFYKLCSNYSPDVVHCWDSMTAVYSIPACKLLKIKIINGSVCDAPLRSSFISKYWLRTKFTFIFSDIIVGNSIAGLKAYNSPQNKSFLIYNGFNFNRLRNLKNGYVIKEQLHISSNYIIGMVASFSEFKDYRTYYQAAQLILNNRRDVTFVAIGRDTDSIRSMNLIDPRYMENFRLLGKKSDIESYINVMDICVLTTYTEGISNSILEYMALEKPVVATIGGGTEEIVINYETGFLVNTSNPIELAEKLEILLNDTQLCSKMGNSGKAIVLKKFSIDQMVMKFIIIYDLLGHKRSKSDKDVDKFIRENINDDLEDCLIKNFNSNK